MKLQTRDMEHVKDTLHRSKFFLIKPIVVWAAGVILIFYFGRNYGVLDSYPVIIVSLFAFITLYFARELMIWRLNCYIISNQRLVKNQHAGIFKRIVTEAQLERILNVSYKTTGLASTTFNYGDVEVQVVGLMEPIILKDVGSPAKIKDYLWLLHSRKVNDQGVYVPSDVPHTQERTGYTKPNQKIL